MAFVNRIGNVLKQTISKHVNVESCIYQAVRSMSTKLFVGGLSYGTDEMSLSQAFSQHGKVIEARIIIDRDNGRSRGFGFVTFSSSEEAARAMQALDGQDLHGRRLRVNYATEKPRGPRYAGGFGSDGGFGYGGSQSGPYGGAGGGGGYDRVNYGSNNNYAGGSSYNYAGGSNYHGSGVSGNSASGNAYSNDGNIGDLGTGGGNDFFSSMSTNPGDFPDSGYNENTSPNFGNAQEELSGSQFGDVNVDDNETEMQDGEYKDENDEPNDFVNRSV